ncbi:hypothetical protein A1O7_08549 [Cladophialophora yegresii CBS 114405]|uniref:Cation/H+ exchanger transmembrane domain-containing protein n=1 Tax=Cladophialophora yegresii CBS 114405 TaxID=1182544 RepID=W9VRH6_9EURO|nr:uncharacterized protein A1O7_08549 [Cladophialophora yegresii CBS 114405]EXJ55620.1 hypothetical protein A1O7_08549 [Cladophialophora yegresii CBS 114405]
MATADEVALPYHEPGIVTILTLVSFILLLNVANHIIDKILYCGLLVQLFLGIGWGTPGANWLGRDFEHVAVNLGYLGLLLIVYEGGLMTSFKALKDNVLLSLGVAITGIALPISASYILVTLVEATPLQAFAAGAALCSTSLGTTFTVMKASSLSTTKMGIVLTSAAMMDDVVGLVMVQVISNLGGTSSSFSAVTIVRPICVSIGFVCAVPLAARFIVQPFTTWLNGKRTTSPTGYINYVLTRDTTALIIHTAILVCLITATTYAGTSNLFAAYLAGASINWWDNTLSHPTFHGSGRNLSIDHTDRSQSMLSAPSSTSGIEVFKRFFYQPLQRILKPLFFASIGFSVPITRMFTGGVIWRGVIYTIFMFISKFACGFWLMRLPGLAAGVLGLKRSSNTEKKLTGANKIGATAAAAGSGSVSDPQKASLDDLPAPKSSAIPEKKQSASRQSNEGRVRTRSTVTSTLKPISLYPGCIVGSAMVARGEIGFLISALAESNGIFGGEPNASIFLIVTWAIMLCTIVGPVIVGTLVARVKKMEGRAGEGQGREGVLGEWGVR